MTRREFTRKIMSITPAYLAECLHYDQRTGDFYWRERPLGHFSTTRAMLIFNSRYAGKKAGSIGVGGYLTIRVSGVLLYAHRVAIILQSGEPIPNGLVVDHKNGKRDDNREENLRLADATVNAINQRQRKRDLPKGVHWDADRRKYLALVGFRKKQHTAGRFSTAKEALEAANALRAELHGENAVPGHLE